MKVSENTPRSSDAGRIERPRPAKWRAPKSVFSPRHRRHAVGTPKLVLDGVRQAYPRPPTKNSSARGAGAGKARRSKRDAPRRRTPRGAHRGVARPALRRRAARCRQSRPAGRPGPALRASGPLARGTPGCGLVGRAVAARVAGRRRLDGALRPPPARCLLPVSAPRSRVDSRVRVRRRARAARPGAAR